MLIEDNNGLSVLMHVMFSSFIINPTNQIVLSDLKIATKYCHETAK